MAVSLSNRKRIKRQKAPQLILEDLPSTMAIEHLLLEDAELATQLLHFALVTTDNLLRHALEPAFHHGKMYRRLD